MQYQSFIPHLEELRRRIIYSLVFFVAALIGCLALVGRLYRLLVLPGVRLTILGPGDVVQIYLMLGGVAALIVTTPFLLWQLWSFAAPGLLPRERRYARRLTLPVALMFAAGVCFSYFLVFPHIYRFLIELARMNQINAMVTAKEYFSFLINITLPFGVIFELPVVVIFLTRIGVITPRLLRKVRRFAYLICVVIGTLISPPELISHLSVTLPMILMYEISVTLSAVTYRRKQAAEAWWREADAPAEPDGAGEGGHSGDDSDDDPPPDGGDGPSGPGGGAGHGATESEAGESGSAHSPVAGPGVERALQARPSGSDAPRAGKALPDRRVMDLLRRPPVLPRRPGIRIEERE